MMKWKNRYVRGDMHPPYSNFGGALLAVDIDVIGGYQSAFPLFSSCCT
jgi:hypothetical protein